MPRSFVEQFIDCNFIWLDALSASKLRSNLVFSPLGFGYNLSMALYGADGLTEAEIRKFSFNIHHEMATKDLLQMAYKFLLDQVGLLKSSHSFHWALKLLVPKGTNLSESYKETLAMSKRITCEEYDWKDKTLLRRINEWSVSYSRNEIPKCVYLPFTDKDSAVMANLIYFRGTWTQGFDPSLTKPRYFFNSSQGHRAIDVETMYGQLKVQYLRYGAITMFRLDYEGGFELIIAYHDQCGVSIHSKEALECLHNFDAKKYLTLEAKVYLPKFQTEQQVDLADIMPQLKVKRMFNPDAEFPGISNNGHVHFSRMTTTVRLEVDECGTNPKTVEPVEVDWASNQIPIMPTIRVDRPFMFFLRHSESQLIVISGYVHCLEEVHRIDKPSDAELKRVYADPF